MKTALSIAPSLLFKELRDNEFDSVSSVQLLGVALLALTTLARRTRLRSSGVDRG